LREGLDDPASLAGVCLLSVSRAEAGRGRLSRLGGREEALAGSEPELRIEADHIREVGRYIGSGPKKSPTTRKTFQRSIYLFFFQVETPPNIAMDWSRESTVTLAGNETLIHRRPSMMDNVVPEHVPDHILDGPVAFDSSKRLIMAVDFGTTYSAIAYVALEDGQEDSAGFLDPTHIRTVQNYPDDATFGGWDDEMRSEVPTELIYPLDRDFRKEEGLVAREWEDQHEDVREPAIDEFGADPDDPLNIFGGEEAYDSDQMSVDEAASFRWGYGAHEVWGRSATHANPENNPVARFKLLLDNSERTETVRNELGGTLQELKRKRVIKDPRDVIVDFLTCLLRHAKAEFQNAGFDNSNKLETILCVPAIWSQKACRDMQTAMAIAMGRAGFPGVDVEDNNIDNLFIVSEPEAAAAFVLAESRDISVGYLPISNQPKGPQGSSLTAFDGHQQGDTFVILDAGRYAFKPHSAPQSSVSILLTFL
jgi:hypothetical protein